MVGLFLLRVRGHVPKIGRLVTERVPPGQRLVTGRRTSASWYIPLQFSPCARSGAPIMTPSAVSSRPMDTSPHILVVDDSADIRDPLAKYLSKKGLRVSTADGGQELRRVMKTSAIDLVILDVMMPGEDGLVLCRMIRETTDTPVILLTAMVEETDRIVGLEIGADDYVTKPFSPRELLARVKAVLRRSRGLPRSATTATPGRLRFDQWTLDTG